jgi:signal peptidase I
MLLLLALVIAVVIKTLLVQAFFIPSASMFPTLHVGDRILIEKVSYRFRSPEPGDVVVFRRVAFGGKPKDLPWYDDVKNYGRELIGLPTSGNEEDYIKRVVAVGGDTIRYRGSPRRLVVNHEVVDEPYIRGGVDPDSGAITSDTCKRMKLDVAGRGCRVPAGKVFVMGDNRRNSADSRSIGPVSDNKILGRAFVVLWPLPHFSGL